MVNASDCAIDPDDIIEAYYDSEDDTPLELPIVVGTEVIGRNYWMPSESNPKADRGTAAQRAGMFFNILGLTSDVAELGQIITTPLVTSDEQGAAFADLLITTLGGFFSGENYIFEQPHPELPSIISVNDDFLVTSGDLIIAGAASKAFPKVGGVVAGDKGMLVGEVAGLAVDATTTIYSLQHDVRKWFYQSNSLSVGVSVGPERVGEIIVIHW